MLAARDAFFLAYLPSVPAIRHENLAILDRLAGEKDEKLSHAVDFSRKTQSIGEAQVKQAAARIDEIVRRAGLASPDDAERHLGDDLARAAWAAGKAAARTDAAVWVARNLAYLRTSAPAHEGLRAEAEDRARALAGAARDLARALSGVSGRRGIEVAAASVRQLLAGAPDLAAATTTAHFKALFEWAKKLDGALVQLGNSFDNPAEAEVTAPYSPEEDAAWLEILARPQDDAARLRWAELAARRNDPRAEVIREQLRARELGRDGGVPGRDVPHKERARQLILAHPEWTEPLAALGARDPHFQRGFVNEIAIDASRFIENASKIFALAPIERVNLIGAAGKVAELAKLPQLARLRAISLAENGLGDEDVAALAASPHLGGLRYLGLAKNRITDRGIETLAESPLGALVSVNLSGNPGADPVDRQSYYDETRYEWAPTEAGRKLEARAGRKLAWLHPPKEGWHLGFRDV